MFERRWKDIRITISLPKWLWGDPPPSPTQDEPMSEEDRIYQVAHAARIWEAGPKCKGCGNLFGGASWERWCNPCIEERNWNATTSRKGQATEAATTGGNASVHSDFPELISTSPGAAEAAPGENGAPG